MKNYICIKQLDINRGNDKYSFIKDETYIGNKISNDWYCVDSVGIKTNTFNEHFINAEDEEIEMSKANE